MREIIAFNQVTLDGIMQAPGGPEEDASSGFTHGGWAMHFLDEMLGEALGEMMSGEFDLLLGRRTYDVFARYWPQAGEGPIAKAFNRATKYVVTNTPDHRVDWAITHRIRGDAADGIRRLKATDGSEIHLWGSHQLLQALIGAELIDEFRLLVYPVVLGTGKRLFETGVPPLGLTLVGESRRTPKGVEVALV